MMWFTQQQGNQIFETGKAEHFVLYSMHGKLIRKNWNVSYGEDKKKKPESFLRSESTSGLEFNPDIV